MKFLDHYFNAENFIIESNIFFKEVLHAKFYTVFHTYLHRESRIVVY